MRGGRLSPRASALSLCRRLRGATDRAETRRAHRRGCRRKPTSARRCQRPRGPSCAPPWVARQAACSGADAGGSLQTGRACQPSALERLQAADTSEHCHTNDGRTHSLCPGSDGGAMGAGSPARPVPWRNHHRVAPLPKDLQVQRVSRTAVRSLLPREHEARSRHPAREGCGGPLLRSRAVGCRWKVVVVKIIRTRNKSRERRLRCWRCWLRRKLCRRLLWRCHHLGSHRRLHARARRARRAIAGGSSRGKARPQLRVRCVCVCV